VLCAYRDAVRGRASAFNDLRCQFVNRVSIAGIFLLCQQFDRFLELGKRDLAPLTTERKINEVITDSRLPPGAHSTISIGLYLLVIYSKISLLESAVTLSSRS